MRKYSWAPILLIPIAIVVAFLIGRSVYFGSGSTYIAPERPLTDIPLDIAARSERLTAVDNPTVSEGVVVVDYAHSNAFFIEELNTLFSKIVARGFSYEVVFDGEAKEGEGNTLAEKLRYAKALILPVPRVEYTPEEILEIERFVERGGRLFIISDPTRTVVVEALNSVAGSFGIIFSNDYLYSLKNNDNNYRNVVYTDFQASPVTAGLDADSKVIFYAGNSVNAPGHEIIRGDDTTGSSTSEGGRATASAALTTNDQVLAIGDLTFFSEPYSTAENNGILINNIADFLAGGQPTYKLTDFPYFFNTNIDIVFNDPLVFNSQFEDAAKLKEFLEAQERTVTFADEIGDENDVIFIGRYNNTKGIEDYLEAANISILDPALEEEEEEEEAALAETEAEGGSSVLTSRNNAVPAEDGKEARFIAGRIQIKGIGDLERGGSTLFYLVQDNDRNVLIILSDSADTNEDAFELLFDNKLIECQAAPQIAVCQTADPEEDLPPSLRSTRIAKILIVADDNGRAREDELTGAVEFTDAFSETTYVTDVWVTSDKGSPDLDELQQHDAVIWTTGDYWDDSINQEDVEVLTEYVTAGGNLILSGASIAFDWDHTDFLSDIVHADYLDLGEQEDLAVAMPDHPIAEDFEEDQVISFTTSLNEEAFIDVVNYTPDSRVIFRRGPDSEAPEAPAVIAYEDERVKIAYYAFPIYLVPGPERALLVNNTIDWFTRRPLDLPDNKDYDPFVMDETSRDSTSPEDEEAPADDSEDSGGGEDEQTGDNGDDGDNSGDNEDTEDTDDTGGDDGGSN